MRTDREESEQNCSLPVAPHSYLRSHSFGQSPIEMSKMIKNPCRSNALRMSTSFLPGCALRVHGRVYRGTFELFLELAAQSLVGRPRSLPGEKFGNTRLICWTWRCSFDHSSMPASPAGGEEARPDHSILAAVFKYPQFSRP